MKTINITDEQYEFLKKMSENMEKQYSRGTAYPLFCVYQKVKIFTPEDFSDDFEFYDKEENSYSLEEIIELLKNKDEFLAIFDCEEKLYDRFIEEEYNVESIADDLNLELQYYRTEIVPVSGQVYFTEEEAQNHIDFNNYHYKEPFTYVVNAWRNPEMKTILDILYGITNGGKKY